MPISPPTRWLHPSLQVSLRGQAAWFGRLDRQRAAVAADISLAWRRMTNAVETGEVRWLGRRLGGWVVVLSGVVQAWGGATAAAVFWDWLARTLSIEPLHVHPVRVNTPLPAVPQPLEERDAAIYNVASANYDQDSALMDQLRWAPAAWVASSCWGAGLAQPWP